MGLFRTATPSVRLTPMHENLYQPFRNYSSSFLLLWTVQFRLHFALTVTLWDELMTARYSAGRAPEPCGLAFCELERLGDDELMRHLRAGHHDALTVLFDRYHRLVLKVALKIVRDPGEAQDVTQEVFLQLYRTVVRFDPDKGSSKMWILRAAYRRSLSRRQYLMLRGFYAGKAPEPCEEIEAPVFRMHLPESRRLVLELLQKLRGQQRKVVELACFEGLTMQEIADRMGESLGNIRHHYYRGVDQLRKLMVEAAPQTGPAPASQEAPDVQT